MEALFNYTDYRQYLADFYQHSKSVDASFSYRKFLTKAGLKGPNFYKEVVDGKKNLSPASIIKFSKALGLSKREQQYFTNLVLFNQAKTAAKKKKFFAELAEFARRSPVQKIQKSQYEYFSKWYNVTIREYIHANKFKGDCEKLAEIIEPKISARQVRNSVKLLEELGLISKGKDGCYYLKDRIISTGPEINSIGAYDYYKAMLDNSKKALDTFKRNERYFRSVSGSFSEDAFQKIKLELDNARKRILDIIEEDEGKKQVYHVGMQLYPMQRKRNKRGGESEK